MRSWWYIVFSITLIPYLSLLRQSQLRPLSVIRCRGLPNEYICLQSLINLKKTIKQIKKEMTKIAWKKFEVRLRSLCIQQREGGGGRGYFWKGQSFSYPFTWCRIFWHPPSWPKEKRRKKFHPWCKTKKIFKDLLTDWWEFACDHFWLYNRARPVVILMIAA